jgi:hypothetical protein
MPLEEAVPDKTSRHPPIVLTSTTNLTQLRKLLKDMIKEKFEFRSTRNRTRIITKDMADFSAFRSNFENNNLSLFMFYPKSEEPIKAVIRHLTPRQRADLTDW